MSNLIAWIAAEAERPPIAGAAFELNTRRGKRRAEELRETEFSGQGLPAHQFPGESPRLAKEAGDGAPGSPAPGETEGANPMAEQQLEVVLDPEQERQRRIYRRRTVALLRRYMRHSIETGRLPSLLGKEFFRAKVTAYTVVTFEDRVIFVHDMETCLERLDEFSRQVLTRVVLQEYEHEQAARLLGCTRMTVHRKLIEALDGLADILLGVGLLEALDSIKKKSCQEGEKTDFCLSDCEQRK